MRRAMLFLLWAPAVILGAVLVAEFAIRGVYTVASWRSQALPVLYERLYWTTPPWVGRQSIIYEDAELGPWMRPQAHRKYFNLFGPIGDLDEVGRLFEELNPEVPSWAQPRSTWQLDTSSRGMRDDEYSEKKPAGVFRIAMLGDSWTVGVNVERPETIPDQLERKAAERFPQGRFEVLNFGMIGAGLETGRRLLPRVVAADPDVVVLAYAQNDEAKVARADLPDRTPASSSPETRSWRRAFDGLEVLGLYRSLTAPSRRSARATIERELTRTGGVPGNVPARMCPNASGPAFSEYEHLLDELIAGVRRSGAE